MGFISEGFILKVLSKHNSHGWGLITSLQEASDGEVEWMPGSIYDVLHRLEDSGCIEGVPDLHKKYKKHYQITDTGREKLKEEEKWWAMFHEIVNYKL